MTLRIKELEGAIVFALAAGAALGAYALGAETLSITFAAFAVGAATIKPAFRGRR